MSTLGYLAIRNVDLFGNLLKAQLINMMIPHFKIFFKRFATTRDIQLFLNSFATKKYNMTLKLTAKLRNLLPKAVNFRQIERQGKLRTLMREVLKSDLPLLLFQSDRDLLMRTHVIQLTDFNFDKNFLIMLFAEYLRFTAMTNNKDCAVFSLVTRSLFMTTGHTKGTGLELVSKIQPPFPMTHKELYLTHCIDRVGKSHIAGRLSFVPKYE